MKKALFFVVLFGIAFFNPKNAKAQDSSQHKSADSLFVNLQDSLKAFEKELDSLIHPKKKSYLKIEVAFLSNNVYFGRKDSVATPYITPSIGYYHKSGLYFNALVSYLPTSGQNRFDLFTLEAGYQHRFGDFQMQLVGSKFFYNNNSYNVESEIKETFAAAFSFDWKVITPVIMGTLIFGQATDYAGSFGLEHTFYAAKNKLQITPSVVANASTENYYNSYYELRRYAIKRLLLRKLLRRDSVNYTINANVIDASKFKVMDYEVSLPITYSVKKFVFSFTPVYAIPTNASQVHVIIKTASGIQLLNKTYTEKLYNSFFFQAGISYRL